MESIGRDSLYILSVNDVTSHAQKTPVDVVKVGVLLASMRRMHEGSVLAIYKRVPGTFGLNCEPVE